MSWQTYIDSNLLGTGKIAHAAIIGLQGGIWAQSANFKLSADEQKAILAAHTSPDQTRTNGIRLAGQKYFTLSVEGRSVYGKKAGDGCLLVKTKQAILVAVYNAPTQAPEATPVVEGLADYLIGVNY